MYGSYLADLGRELQVKANGRKKITINRSPYAKLGIDLYNAIICYRGRLGRDFQNRFVC